MTIKKIVALSCLLSLLDAAAQAQGLDWNVDPLAQFKTTMAAQKVAITLPRCTEVNPPTTPAATVRVEARPLGSTALLHERLSSQDKVSLTLNNGKDRVGATFSNCPESDDAPICDRVDFVFPQLSVDRQAKVIKLGDEVVGKLGWQGLSLAKGWRLVASKTKKTADTDFDRYTYNVVSVALIKSAAGANTAPTVR